MTKSNSLLPLTLSPTTASSASNPATVLADEFLLTLAQLLQSAAPTVAGIGTSVANSESADPKADTNSELSTESGIVPGLSHPLLMVLQEQMSRNTTLPNEAASEVVLKQLSTAFSPASSAAESGLIAAELATPSQQTELSGPQLSGSIAQPREMPAVVHQSVVRAEVNSGQWTDELGAQLTWLTNKHIDAASLKLSPEHLGPLEVRIAVRDDQVSVWFGAAHADTRLAVEQALPRLRELFVQQGLVLTEAGVSEHGSRERQDVHRGPDAHAPESVEEVQAERVHVGLVDAYA